MAIYDATIAAWESKYFYNRQRPSTMDKAIQPKVDVPASPSYPSDYAATAGAAEVKSKGAFIDVRGYEEVRVKTTQTTTSSSSTTGTTHPTTSTTSTTHEKSAQISGEFVLAPNETKTFEGQFQVPQGILPSYNGPNAKHLWEIRGRIEAWGNDPDSGFKPLRVGYRE